MIKEIETELHGTVAAVKESVVQKFGWANDANICIVNAGSTRGGHLGHDIDVVTLFDISEPKLVAEPFVASLESIEAAILELGKKGVNTFSFSRVAWQDFMADFASGSGSEPVGIHFLWYANAAQLTVSEPRALALGLMDGETWKGNSGLKDKVKTEVPCQETCLLWQGLDQVLDPIRLIANPNIELARLNTTIGHSLERFVVWDILAQRARAKNGFDLVSRQDLKLEMELADEVLLSILNRSRILRDAPATMGKRQVISLATDIITNWKSIRRLE